MRHCDSAELIKHCQQIDMIYRLLSYRCFVHVTVLSSKIIVFVFSDVLCSIEKVSEELHTSFHCYQVFLYVLSLELVSAAVHIHFYESNIRLRGYDHHIAQLCLPGQNRFSRRS